MAVSKFTSASGGNDFNINVGSTYSVTNFTQEYSAGSYSFTSAQLDTTMDVYAYNSQGTLVGYTNGKGLTTSAGFIKMVIIGGTVGDVLSFTYKTTYYAVAETAETTAGPVILSITPTSLPNANSSTTVTGLNFATDVAATFTGTDSLVRNAKSVVRGSATSLVVTRPDNMPTAYSPYTLTVTNPSVAYQPTGSNSNIVSVTAGVNPVWVTTAGELYSNTILLGGSTVSTSVSATDADLSSNVTYSIVSGALPTGASLNTSNGTISGAVSNTTTTTYNFTIRATDSGGNTADRAFSITVTQDQLSSIPNRYAWYVPASLNSSGTTWSDISGNGYSWTITSPVGRSTSNNANGASGNFTCLEGSNSSTRSAKIANGFLFSSSNNFTFIHVARNFGTRRRVWVGTDNNWLSGFHGGNSGVQYHEGWVSSSTDYHGSNWVVSIDKHNYYRSNGTVRGTSGNGSYSTAVDLNSSESSDFQIAEVLVYNRALNDSEIATVESYLRTKYGI
jgi:hypothetical protein